MKTKFKVSHKLYIIILLIAVFTLCLALVLKHTISNNFVILAEVIINLCYGLIASTVVSWLIDISNTNRENKKATELHNIIYADLKVSIAHYIALWATLCAICFKDYNYEKEKHTWLEWYKLTKSNYLKTNNATREHILNFFKDEISNSVKYVRDSIDKINSQKYALVINEVMDSKLLNIISDFEFEFTAYNMELNLQKDDVRLWRSLDAINNDLEKYILSWNDIKHYNHRKFSSTNSLSDIFK